MALHRVLSDVWLYVELHSVGVSDMSTMQENMKLKILSDLHIDHYERRFILDKLRRIAEGDYDYIVDAGDVGVKAEHWGVVADAFHGKYIYVPGNHDRYKKGYWTPLESHFVKVLNGVKFVCTTLFSSLDFHEVDEVRSCINDFQYVSVDKFQSLHKMCREFLEREITRDCVVVTHFMPSFKSVAKEYERSAINSFFATDLEYLIEDKRPKLWVHGHTHSAFDYTIGSTRILCNPLGYPAERSLFNENLIVEV